MGWVATASVNSSFAAARYRIVAILYALSAVELLQYSTISCTSLASICADRPVADHAAVAWHRTQLWLHIIVNAM